MADSPFSSHSCYDAYAYAELLLKQKKEKLNSIFFFSDSVYLANSFSKIGYDEFNVAEKFLSLNEKYKTKLLLCVGACQKRGIIDDQVATQNNQTTNLYEGYQLAGLVRLYESIIQSNELVLFKKNRQITTPIKDKNTWVFYSEFLPYENYYFRELLELALAIASFDEKVYFVVDGLAQDNLKQDKPEYSKNITKMLLAANDFNVEIINQNQYQNIKNQGCIEFN